MATTQTETPSTTQKDVIPYEGYRNQTALLCIERAAEFLAACYRDDGSTPWTIRNKYGEVVKTLNSVMTRIMRIDELDAQRKVPCYTVENGRLVKVKLDDLLKMLEDQNGELDL